MTYTARTGPPASGEPEVRLGLRANLPQFLLLAVVNFFVGGMVGTERTVIPLVGSEQFGLGAAAVSDASHPAWRAPALGVYRFWRDAGYAIGALIGGITAAVASLDAAVGVAAVLTAVSGILAWACMRETHPRPVADGGPARAAAGEAARRVNGGMT